MRSLWLCISLGASAFAASLPSEVKSLVETNKLQNLISKDRLLKHAQNLEAIAYSTPLRNRVTGSEGHNKTVEYIVEQLTSDESLRQFYEVKRQIWQGVLLKTSNGNLTVDGTRLTTFRVARFSNSGNFTAPLVHVAQSGCRKEDYGSSVNGSIALIQRGGCPYLQQSIAAAQAGAVALLVYNNVPATFAFRLSAKIVELKRTVPTGSLSGVEGLALAALVNLSSLSVQLVINSVVEERTTTNIIAETRDGSDNVTMLGAHSDSVAAGPGINDNGSGTIALIEVARQLSKFQIKKRVRFAWFSGEEQGMLGSNHYVSTLTREESLRIHLYLNFDMIASPNFVYGIHGGKVFFNGTAAPGSERATAVFEEYFAINKLPSQRAGYGGSSDYAPFMLAGVPSGGLLTGAGGKKTDAEAKLYGGVAGKPHDANYHQPGDTVANLNMDAFFINTKAIAHAVAVYARNDDVHESYKGS